MIDIIYPLSKRTPRTQGSPRSVIYGRRGRQSGTKLALEKEVRKPRVREERIPVCAQSVVWWLSRQKYIKGYMRWSPIIGGSGLKASM